MEKGDRKREKRQEKGKSTIRFQYSLTRWASFLWSPEEDEDGEEEKKVAEVTHPQSPRGRGEVWLRREVRGSQVPLTATPSLHPPLHPFTTTPPPTHSAHTPTSPTLPQTLIPPQPPTLTSFFPPPPPPPSHHPPAPSLPRPHPLSSHHHPSAPALSGPHSTPSPPPGPHLAPPYPHPHLLILNPTPWHPLFSIRQTWIPPRELP